MRRLLLPALLLVATGVAVLGAVISDRGNTNEPSGEAATAPAAATPVLSPRRVPTLLVEPRADAALDEVLTDIVAESPEGTCLVVTRDGATIFAHNPDRWMVPASTEKIFTAAAALDGLGPDHTFTTEVRLTDEIGVDGVLVGDVWLLGGGDPVLDTPGYLARFPTARPATDLEGLADELVGAGLTQIEGAVFGDESRYDAARTVPSWSEANVAANRSGPLSALMINDGFDSFPEDSPDNASASPSSDPAASAAAVFDDLLEARGVTISGGAGSGLLPGQTVLVASAESPPLREILVQMNTFSDNTTAEQLVKELGVAVGVAGTTAAGTDVVVDTLTELGAQTVSVADGSGLSRDNITTCTALTTTLDHHGPESPLVASLAVGGETGTLAGRFLDASTRGRVLAKSGSLADASGLAGMVRTPSERMLTFAYLVNGPIIDQAAIDALTQELAEALTSWPDGPDIADAAPADTGS
ncbi:MAG: D-alanyl-D-alanine carboxypeptidase/D-alanyl-D-alanine endopeptidase [Acidimicrobiales bacterium]